MGDRDQRRLGMFPQRQPQSERPVRGEVTHQHIRQRLDPLASVRAARPCLFPVSPRESSVSSASGSSSSDRINPRSTRALPSWLNTPRTPPAAICSASQA